MLVLSRKIGEEIIIGDNVIKVMVTGIHGGQVKLGIAAPKGVDVHRKEIFEAIQREGDNRK